ncbi:MAG: hypothetical protein RL266_1533 [Bacteroidota bacterium]
MINEVSNGSNGNKEFVEFVVVDTAAVYNCGLTEPPCIDIRGWIFDDNSGYHGSGGIASGALRFSNDPLWSCLPLGTIVLLYNDDDTGLLIPADDLTMADNNCRLVVPVSSSLIEKNGTTPGAVSCSYPSSGWIPSGIWSNTFLANSGDCARIVDLSGCEVFSVCWAGCSDNTLIYFNSGGSGSQNVWYFNGNDPTQQSNWSEGSASGGDETPGAPNNAANAEYIAQFNNGCQPIPSISSIVTSTNAACGQCNGSATAIGAGSLPDYSYDWYDANYSSIGQTTAMATGLCAGDYHVMVTSSIGCVDTSHVSITATGSVITVTQNLDACLGSTVTYPDGSSEIVIGPTSNTSVLTGGSGCDSTIVTNVAIVSSYAELENISVCVGSMVTYPDGSTETITSNTIHLSSLTSTSGCDSIITTNVTVTMGYSVVETFNVCGDTTITYPDGVTETVTMNTTHASFLLSADGCDSIVTTNVNIFSNYLLQETVSVCTGENYTFPDGSTQTISNDLIYTSQFNTGTGCDSIIVTDVSVRPSSLERETVSLCIGASYTFADGTVIDPITVDTVYNSFFSNYQGCDSVIRTTIIALNSLSEPTFTWIPINPDQDDNEVTFSTEETGILNWSIRDFQENLLFSSSDTGFVYAFPYDSIYPHIICLAVEENGCFGEVCDTVSIEAETTVYIPNTFTPHEMGEADGINDVFLPIIGGGTPYRYTLEIFDRWGEKLFESSDPYQGWNGTYKGKLVEQAVYAYRLRFSIVPLTFIRQYTGHINVLK